MSALTAKADIRLMEPRGCVRRRGPPKLRNIMQLIRAIIVVEIVAIVLLSRHAGGQTTKELNTIADIYAAIRACWKTPKISGPAELAVRLSFTRDGKILGKARVTYENKTVPDENRLRFRIAVMDTFKRCSPFSFSPDLGDAVAGKPFSLHSQFGFRSLVRRRRSPFAMMSALPPHWGAPTPR